MTKTNPFKPFNPVSPGMFVGRLREIKRLETHLAQTKAGNPAHAIICGERGIGKSSLLNYFKWVGEGAIPLEGSTMKFLVIDTDIDPGTTQLALIEKIGLGLRRALSETEAARTFLRNAWSFLRRIEAGGVRLNPADFQRAESTMIEEFAYSLADTADRLTGEPDTSPTFSARYDGILILIDETDKASPRLALGSFLKLLLERLERRGCNRVMVVLAGLPSLRDILLRSHPSSLRLFDLLFLDRLVPDEVGRVVDIALERASESDSVNYEITSKARQLLVSLAEGYPHFIQQFGYSAFDVDRDNRITHADVWSAAFEHGGALDLIGERYYRSDFYDAIQTEAYRQVLRIMADNLDGWVPKREIKQRFTKKASILNNAIKTLRDRHIILSKEGERGVYRLQHRGFALWIKLRTTDPKELELPLFPFESAESSEKDD